MEQAQARPNAAGETTRLDQLAGWVGEGVVSAFSLIGNVIIFIWNMTVEIPKFFKDSRATVEQMAKIGITSLPLVFLTSIFTGAVTAYQAAYQFSDYIPLTYLGTAVGKSIMLSLGPVLTALVVAGRVGAAMAAEIGTMRVTEQIDAMECLSLNPFRYLFMPRFVASLVMLPVLVIFSSFVGIMGALIVAAGFFDLDSKIFFSGVKLFFSLKDVFIGMFKAFIFGGIIATIGCYYGYFTSGGAVGVGESTKKSVVASSVLILIGCYLVDGVFL
ncbi:MAG: hypothetical protein A2268_11040 [Candidatus Raymondbacteria bacterium RifOxyA12_full_50_37]|nr:MAG: hypothetical protein A2268_11040 [Candidatus Raymondbacteria bacterium RifOxyA12_full_50_37]OGJ85546.1 MAG: hypothetical protein A2248_12825 [Candidatus Raymondbacteria bacterium RIFOXYA2_FULL_49_16]OGJ94680.1 MAG: hypothetical protein A2487_08050 [Candidatus Raymondbacteria bacterium RifOxyC12_full_50_8]OGJ95049.1 MAG: hypothetical protein A2453_07525 [Candidatus Raymondbacteria bacterium RIFOXYC2_FULL_50_21]OGK04465.1 MAG: hypothetical protein A2350_05740 [Candidatus Raymondbacteria b